MTDDAVLSQLRSDLVAHHDPVRPSARQLAAARIAHARRWVGWTRPVLLAIAAVLLAAADLDPAGLAVAWVAVGAAAALLRWLAGMTRVLRRSLSAAAWATGTALALTVPSVALVALPVACAAGAATCTALVVRRVLRIRRTVRGTTRDTTLAPLLELGAPGSAAALLVAHLDGLGRYGWQALADLDVPSPLAAHLALARAQPAGLPERAWRRTVAQVVAADRAAADVLYESAARHLPDVEALRASAAAAWLVRAGLLADAPVDVPIPQGVVAAGWQVVGEVQLGTGDRPGYVAARAVGTGVAVSFSSGLWPQPA